MVLIGLPQLLIFPFVPRLMKRFDLRLIVFVGALIFGGSCLMNIYMNPQYGGPQFQIGNIVRALGQPFTIVPLSAGLSSRRPCGAQRARRGLLRIMSSIRAVEGAAAVSAM